MKNDYFGHFLCYFFWRVSPSLGTSLLFLLLLHQKKRFRPHCVFFGFKKYVFFCRPSVGFRLQSELWVFMGRFARDQIQICCSILYISGLEITCLHNFHMVIHELHASVSTNVECSRYRADRAWNAIGKRIHKSKKYLTILVFLWFSYGSPVVFLWFPCSCCLPRPAAASEWAYVDGSVV